jgi:hypothetical protein
MEREFLMNAIRQVLAIAQTEFRFAFRRGAPVIIMILVGLLVGAGMMMAPLTNMANGEYATSMTPEQVQKWTANGLTLEERPIFVRDGIGDMFVYSSILAWWEMFAALLLLPVATIVAIPADHVFGTWEWLRTTPLTGARYLAGKFLGTLAAVLVVAAVMLGLFFAVANVILMTTVHFWLSWYASLYFIELSLLGGLPLLAWATAAGTLPGVLFRSRRAAIFPGLVVGLLSVYFWVSAFRSPSSEMLMDKVVYFLLENNHSGATAIEAKVLGQTITLTWITTRIGIGQVLLMYLALLAAFLLLAGLARLWLQWKENF